jgi:hypothetical protein
MRRRTASSSAFRLDVCSSILANRDSTSKSLLILMTAFAVLSAFITLSVLSHMANG